MKISDVVRGVEKKTYQNTREWMNGGAYRADGYNSLASAEVVVQHQGEFINDELKTLLPKDRLSKFERNFIAYKLWEALEKKLKQGEVLTTKAD